ncbi:MAG TPA: hypothetical protein ENK13_02660 [Thermopetrobacter sp.]|nr:hypothetical protein [Thermopetrobacter sp.]
MKRRRTDGDETRRTPLRPFLLIALAGAVYIGLELAVTVWKSWLAAGAVVAFGMALFWLIWPETTAER